MAKTCGFCEKSTEVGRVEKCGHTVKRWCRCSVTGKEHAADHPCDVPEKPRLCEVLGVDVGQRFKVMRDAYAVVGPIYIRDDGILVNPLCSIDTLELLSALIEAINHPEKIVRVPSLTPEEVQRCRAFGAKWVSQDMDSNQVWLWEERPAFKSNGVWDGGTSCAQVWARYFPSVKPGQLIPVEDEP